MSGKTIDEIVLEEVIIANLRTQLTEAYDLIAEGADAIHDYVLVDEYCNQTIDYPEMNYICEQMHIFLRDKRTGDEQ
jgi:hypothetical protein